MLTFISVLHIFNRFEVFCIKARVAGYLQSNEIEPYNTNETQDNMNKIVSNLRAKTGPQHLFEYNLQNVVKTNNNNKKNICILKLF